MDQNSSPHMFLITQEYIDSISDYFPLVDISKISNVSQKNGVLTFRFENKSYTCLLKQKKEIPSSLLDIQSDFLESVFQILKVGDIQAKNVSYAFWERAKNILKEYDAGIDVQHITDMYFSGGYILFTYAKAMYMCPAQHNTFDLFQDGQSEINQILKISDIIKKYFPVVELGVIRDLVIENGMIGFTYMSEKYFCPIISPDKLENDYKGIREREEQQYSREVKKDRKAILKRVK